MRCWQLLTARRGTPPTSADDARDALSKSVDDLLGGVRARQQAKALTAGLAGVERRNHLADSVRSALREGR